MKTLYEAHPELIWGADLIPLFAIILLGGLICSGWMTLREWRRTRASEHDIHQFSAKTKKPGTS